MIVRGRVKTGASIAASRRGQRRGSGHRGSCRAYSRPRRAKATGQAILSSRHLARSSRSNDQTTAAPALSRKNARRAPSLTRSRMVGSIIARTSRSMHGSPRSRGPRQLRADAIRRSTPVAVHVLLIPGLRSRSRRNGPDSRPLLRWPRSTRRPLDLSLVTNFARCPLLSLLRLVSRGVDESVVAPRVHLTMVSDRPPRRSAGGRGDRSYPRGISYPSPSNFSRLRRRTRRRAR